MRVSWSDILNLVESYILSSGLFGACRDIDVIQLGNIDYYVHVIIHDHETGLAYS